MKTGSRSGQTFVAAAIFITVSSASTPLFAQASPSDPPARVGRLALTTGIVTYHLAGADQWEPAVPNLPVTTGSAFWTEPGGQAVIGIASDRIVLDQATEFEMSRLDDHVLNATEAQGAVYIHLRTLASRDTFAVLTPRGTVTLSLVGRYEVVAGDTSHPTTVTVIEGQAQVTGTNISLRIGVNQTATMTGDGAATSFRGAIGPAIRDEFLTAALANEQAPPPTGGRAPPAVVRMMTGGDDLDRYGDWSQETDYGPVWYPRSSPDFVPYRNGHWSFVQPWGWTWVDDAPWGFAPSHYGRWVNVNHRWGWTPAIPGRVAIRKDDYPIYAPAVVAFVGGFAVGTLAADAIGWVPLGPREPYYPSYRVSNAYMRGINVANAPDFAGAVNIYSASRQPERTADPTHRFGPGAVPSGVHEAPHQPLVNAAAATAVRAAVMTNSQSVAAAARPVPVAALQTATPIIARPPVAPTRATVGVTPLVVRGLKLPDPATPGVLRPTGPGPTLTARPVGSRGVALREPTGGAVGPPIKASPMLQPGSAPPRANVPATGPTQPGWLGVGATQAPSVAAQPTPHPQLPPAAAQPTPPPIAAQPTPHPQLPPAAAQPAPPPIAAQPPAHPQLPPAAAQPAPPPIAAQPPAHPQLPPAAAQPAPPPIAAQPPAHPQLPPAAAQPAPPPVAAQPPAHPPLPPATPSAPQRPEPLQPQSQRERSRDPAEPK